MVDAMKLKICDATLKWYHALYVKKCGGYGLTEEDQENMRLLFLEASRLVVELLKEFALNCDGREFDDLDSLFDYAEDRSLIHYAYEWKQTYSGLRRRAEEGTMREKDWGKLLSPYDLLKIPNYTLLAWNTMEDEYVITGKDDPELLWKTIIFFACTHPHPLIPIPIQVEKWNEIQTGLYNGTIENEQGYDDLEVVSERKFDDWEEAYLAERGQTYYLEVPQELHRRVFIAKRLHRLKIHFNDVAERTIIAAMLENHTVEFTYCSFKEGKSVTSYEWVAPVALREEQYLWVLVGFDKENQKHEYYIRDILDIDIHPTTFSFDEKILETIEGHPFTANK